MPQIFIYCISLCCAFKLLAMQPPLDPTQAAAKHDQPKHYQLINEQRQQYSQKAPNERKIDMGPRPISFTVAQSLAVLLNADSIVDITLAVSDSEESIVLLAQALKESKHTTNFNMSGFAINEQGWQALLVAVQSNGSLKSLSISFDNIGVKKITELYLLAQKSSIIKKIVINGKSSRCNLGINDPEVSVRHFNEIVLSLDNDGDDLFAEQLLQNNMSLESCEIRGTEVTPDFFACLKGFIEKNSSLSILVIDSNAFDIVAMAYLSESLSPHIKDVDLSGNFDEKELFIAALMFNKGLNKITLNSRQELNAESIEKYLGECHLTISSQKIIIEKKKRKSSGGIRRWSGKRKSGEVNPNKLNSRQST